MAVLDSKFVFEIWFSYILIIEVEIFDMGRDMFPQ
jgi:hypothetical protein